MKRIGWMAGLLLLNWLPVMGQLHLFAGGGAINYQGDLQSWKQSFANFHLYAGGGIYYELSEKLSLRAGVLAGKVSGSDKINRLNANRNLSFESGLLEVQIGAEYDIFNSYEHRLVPYVFAGLAAFKFNPYTRDARDNRIYLQPLGTEGQGFFQGRTRYGLTQVAIPFGGGIKFALTDDIAIRLDGALRRLLTDYLDDVSTTYPNGAGLLANNGQQAFDFSFRTDELNPNFGYPREGAVRGNPKSKDFYYTAGLSVSFRLQYDPYRGKPGKGKLGCPVNIY
jgi:hypothetical protein